MGNFFTSIQIHNPDQLSREQFIELFCNKMKENGFDVSNAEDHEISYVLAFADNCKWVSVSSEVYEQGNAFVQKDAGNIAKTLNTCCINVTVVDSDFAMLDMYSNKGKKLDTAVMGRADDYLGDDIPTPKKNVWSALLSANSTWERFVEVQQGDYVFVEDGLSELAPIISMDGRNILLSADEAVEYENTVFLGFRKLTIKKKKNLSLPTSFKLAYGEFLTPKGFTLLKSKYPYFVRVTNDGIVQSISFAKEKSFNSENESFTIYIGLSLICLPLTDYDKNPTTLDNQTWMMPLLDFFHRCSLYMKGFEDPHKQCSVLYKKGNSEAMLNALKESQKELMPFVIEFVDRYTTLDDMYHLGERIIFGFYRDVVILKQKIDEHLAEREKEFSKQFQQMVSITESNPMTRPMLEATKKKSMDNYNRVNQWLLDRKIGGEAYEEYMKNAAETKNANYKILTDLGVVVPKGE